jgi:hypothetical protein
MEMLTTNTSDGLIKLICIDMQKGGSLVTIDIGA